MQKMGNRCWKDPDSRPGSNQISYWNFFCEKRVIESEMHVTGSIMYYDYILVRDLLRELGMEIYLNDQTIEIEWWCFNWW